MSLIVSQTPVNRLPSELVNNAAFVKYIDSDPVHQTAETARPAERVSSMAGRFDTISISAEALAQAKDIRRLSFPDGTGTPSTDAGADQSQPFRQGPSITDVTGPASAERKKRDGAMSSRNAVVEQLKQAGESSRAHGYAEIIKLFKNGRADWRAAPQKSGPEAHGAWLRMLNGEE